MSKVIFTLGGVAVVAASATDQLWLFAIGLLLLSVALLFHSTGR